MSSQVWKGDNWLTSVHIINKIVYFFILRINFNFVEYLFQQNLSFFRFGVWVRFLLFNKWQQHSRHFSGIYPAKLVYCKRCIQNYPEFLVFVFAYRRRIPLKYEDIVGFVPSQINHVAEQLYWRTPNHICNGITVIIFGLIVSLRKSLLLSAKWASC